MSSNDKQPTSGKTIPTWIYKAWLFSGLGWSLIVLLNLKDRLDCVHQLSGACYPQSSDLMLALQALNALAGFLLAWINRRRSRLRLLQ
ncbi:hypothetical protein NK553_10280 [Pseudomonas sp. ZM23]|uniref:Uncharacterized protein n=1 Tax=Pseudomonas triclosanedens TaxID=2961893 RepID=A0ABY7A1S4_9PSED|nr:hypothetical protein [Pseudomonas triclosanedens]MCP8464335.1 hypothetical protein [Pseudomonas triclosanedens]MCP8471469.1 hypothetical protein [Pseudomonas triclosanedens]MCP8477722.1 hypothetical protein [Pseudomonas triclosanedens]WAI51177.1 hypothetical protein OU419_07940 [Pseudomonas triclosanedens]